MVCLQTLPHHGRGQHVRANCRQGGASVVDRCIGAVLGVWHGVVPNSRMARHGPCFPVADHAHTFSR